MIPSGMSGREDELLSVPLNLAHLERMYDDTGMLQHSSYGLPDRNHGYCIDDTARGLQFLCRLFERSGQDGRPRIDPAYADRQEKIGRMISTSLAFILHAWNPQTRRFRNFMGYNRRWLEEVGSEDSHGRALWSLATARMSAPIGAEREGAEKLFEKGLEPVEGFTSPRAWAFIILAFGEIREDRSFYRSHLHHFEKMAERLFSLFSHVVPSENIVDAESWLWPEPVATYANGRLAHALLTAGELLEDRTMIDAGKTGLQWLFQVQRGGSGQLSIIGNRGWLKRRAGEQIGERARFDQQPIEALCLVEGACEAWQVDEDPAWLERARLAWGWFVGENDHGLPLYDPETGGCFDGLTPEGVNRNMGAESLLAWLISTRVLSTCVRKAGLVLEEAG